MIDFSDDGFFYKKINMGKINFRNSRVLVVGDVMLDRYLHGTTSRISPEAPVPVVHVFREEARVGGAGNVALNAAVLGASTQLLGLTGNDAEANQVESLLAERGVSCYLLRISDNRTITKLRIMSRHQQLIRLDFEDHFPSWNPEALLSIYCSQLDNADAIILSDYAKGTLRQSVDLIATARARKLPVIVDPKGTDFGHYRGATVITPNLSEFEAVVGKCTSDAEIVRKGIDLRDSLNLEAVLVTRSERGMTLIARNNAPLHLPTHAREVFDVTGAGDTVVATLGSALAAGIPMPEAVALSNTAASVVVAKIGTATVNLAELKLAIHCSSINSYRGICDEDMLQDQVELARANGERLVMTNGCFDILHPGHINYLEQARAMGDRLIVAVNDDESVQRLKGSNRPINSISNRMRMLSALSCVDWVVSFSDDTPERLIRKLSPDILVKGGDYTPDQIAGSSYVKAIGGEVRVLDFVSGYSTSHLIDCIRNGAQ